MKLPVSLPSLLTGFLLLCPLAVHAQLGSGWAPYTPTKKIHLDDEAGLQTFNWTTYKSVGTGTPCADYTYDAATDTETFRLFDNRTNRAEIRLQNDYSTGTRQFEGYVTFFDPVNDESLMQIFGSSSGATQLMIRGFAPNGGELRISTSKVIASGVYGTEHRVNVIHLREDSGNKILVYIDGVLKHEMADNENVTNYHKYGCYGTLRTNGAVVKWRAVRHFRNGQAPGSGAPTPPPSVPPLTFEAETLQAAPVNGSVSVSFEDTASAGQFASPNITDPNDPRYPDRRRYVTFGGDGVPPPSASPTGYSEYVDFTLPNVPRGTYTLSLRYKTHPTNRGVMRLFVDGVQAGTDLNQLETATFKSKEFGLVRLTAGNHTVRLAVVGKTNTTTTPWNITADLFTLVPDKTAPVVAAPDDIVVEATGPSGAVATFSTTASDDKDGSVPVTFTPASGSLFPLGENVVVATAMDFAGNIGAASFFVIVIDTTPPVLTLPASVTVEATSADGATVNLPGGAVDLVSGVVPVVFSPASGSVFALGTTAVGASAADAEGNTATGSYVVTVQDTTPPALTLPGNLTLEATGPNGAAASFAASASDLVSGGVPVTFTAASGSTFPLGTTTVNAAATDAAGNTASGSFTVTVRDTTAPVIGSLTASPDNLGAPNHKLVPVSLAAGVSEAVDAAPRTRIVSVSSNESANGNGDGNTAPDWEITGDLTLNLRAERSGGGSGRIYTIVVESRDAAENASTRSVSVVVPKGNGR